MARRFRRYLLTTFGLLLVVIAGGGVWLYRGITEHADLSDYTALAPAPATPSTEIRATFLGVSTILLDDGETQILTDGFFTRPNPKQLFMSKIAPDPAIISNSLARAGITRLAAVIVCHSHYDHAMDAPLVAMQTGAIVVGSSSTANIARGSDVPEDRIRVPADRETMTFGRFKVTLLPSEHVPTGFAQGEIVTPLRPPAPASDYREGGSYAVLVEHGEHSLLINASAGFSRGGFAGRTVDMVFLGVGQLGHQTDAYVKDYWREAVATVHAKRVVPIHWDNFALPLDRPLQPIPRLFDDFAATMRFLTMQGQNEGIDVVLPIAWLPFDPFAKR